MALDFVAGCAGGAAGVLVGFPLDTVKVRIQTQDMSKGVKYTGTFQCLSSIIKQEGARTMYKGISSPLAGVAAINAICFGVYGNVNRRLNKPDSLRSITIAGMASGFVQAFACSPIELIKTQMQVRDDCNKVSDTIRSIVRHSGIKSLARGLGITVCREVPAFGLYFSSYEILVRQKKNYTAWVFTSGGLAGIISWVFTYPIDVVKTKLQADTFGASSKYRNAFQCLKASMNSDGFKVLYRGMGSTVIRAFPVNAATMGMVTMIMKYYSPEVNTHDAIKRLRTSTIVIKLPPSIERYFDQRLQGCNMSYHHNVCTMATDGPSIIHIGRPELNINMSRLYVESMLYSMPSNYHHDEGVTVGTMRSDVSLSTIIRVLERLLVQKEANEGEDSALLWTSVKAFTNKTCDFMIDSSSGAPMTVIADNIITDIKDISMPLKPSLMALHPSRTETITTNDFMQPTSLVTSSENKIYGFYYLV